MKDNFHVGIELQNNSYYEIKAESFNIIYGNIKPIAKTVNRKMTIILPIRRLFGNYEGNIIVISRHIVLLYELLLNRYSRIIGRGALSLCDLPYKSLPVLNPQQNFGEKNGL